MQMSVRSSDEKCYRAHNIYLSLFGQYQDSLRSVSSLPVLTSSDRRSLKYFVLFLDKHWQSYIVHVRIS